MLSIVATEDLLFFDSDFFFFLFFFGTHCRTDNTTLDLVDRYDDLLLCVRHECIDESSVETGEEETQKAFVELAGSVDFLKLQRIKLENHQPVCSFVVPIDREREPLLGPKSAYENLATGIGDHVLDGCCDSTWIACIVIAIEQKQTFVICSGQRSAPQSVQLAFLRIADSLFLNSVFERGLFLS